MDADSLRDRIAAVMYCHRYPRETMRGALAMARGEGMDSERGQTNVVQRQYLTLAQAVIDDLGLTVEAMTLGGERDDGTPFTSTRIVGKCEEEK